ncbi:electron transfer flavoprotein subunit alpha/FixB family protein [Agaribacterium sp. ZY112]|uniref:electron transfer flavoprotein subunit alpha/FixB family protein n=1 Tax=Agaribacterium sp. ZY112 TaxID=3233574 RepID=UPI0035242426
MSILIIAEHENAKLKNNLANLIFAAKQLGDDIHVLIAGHSCSAIADAASHYEGLTKVLSCDAEHYEHQLAEELSPLITDIAKNYSHILFAATTTGKNLMPRVAAMLDSQCLSDVCSINSDTQFVRPIYAGNVLATIECHEAIKLLSIRCSSFDAVEQGTTSAPIEAIEASNSFKRTRFVCEELVENERPELSTAEIVISGGRGLGSAENFELIYSLADKLGAAVGASRAAVDAGFVANDMQVGQTGKIVAPNLYIAVGISGAIQHLAGMKESKTIVAINKDEDAPIFQIADYGLVADLFDAVPELTNKL